MFVRTVYATGDPADLGPVADRLRVEAPEALATQPGYRGFGLMVDREQGVLAMSSWWDSEQADRDSDAKLAQRRTDLLAPFARTVTVDHWEAAVVTDPRPRLDTGAGFRMVQLELDPATIDQMLQSFETKAVPQLKALDGFVGSGFLIDRRAGRASVGFLFRDKAALVASRGPQAVLRGQVVPGAGVKVRGIEEFEVVTVQ